MSDWIGPVDPAVALYGNFRHLEKLTHNLTSNLPPFGPRAFAVVVSKIISELRDSFTKELEKLSQKPIDQQQIPLRARSYLARLRHIQQWLLPFIAEIDHTEVPSEFLSTLFNLADKKPEEFALAFYPVWEFTYETHILPGGDLVNEFLAGTSVNTQQLKDAIPSWFVFIRYPRTESRNALLHTLMLHELTHFWEIEGKIAVQLMSEIALKIDAFQPKTQALFDRCVEITENWVVEIVCDLIATRILGPAYLFAWLFYDSLAGRGDQYSDSHPSTAFRLKYVLEELVEMGYDKEKKPLGGVFADWQSELNKRYHLPSSGEHRVAHDSVNSGIEKIRKSVKRRVPDSRTYTEARFREDVFEDDQLIDSLCHGVIYSDHWNKDSAGNWSNEPLSFVTLLNLGWFVAFFKDDMLYSGFGVQLPKGKAAALDNLSELLLKAIEGSEVLRLWRS